MNRYCKLWLFSFRWWKFLLYSDSYKSSQYVCILIVLIELESIKKFKKLFKDHPRCSFKELEWYVYYNKQDSNLTSNRKDSFLILNKKA